MLPKAKQCAAMPRTNPIRLVIDIPNVQNDAVPAVCRVCLARGVKMYSISKHDLTSMYARVTGVVINASDKLPRHLCWECAARLSSANNFIKKALKTQLILSKNVSNNKFITIRDILSINKARHNLKSTLGTQFNNVNEYDFVITDEAMDTDMFFKKEGNTDDCSYGDEIREFDGKVEETICSEVSFDKEVIKTEEVDLNEVSLDVSEGTHNGHGYVDMGFNEEDGIEIETKHEIAESPKENANYEIELSHNDGVNIRHNHEATKQHKVGETQHNLAMNFKEDACKEKESRNIDKVDFVSHDKIQVLDEANRLYEVAKQDNNQTSPKNQRGALPAPTDSKKLVMIIKNKDLTKNIAQIFYQQATGNRQPNNVLESVPNIGKIFKRFIFSKNNKKEEEIIRSATTDMECDSNKDDITLIDTIKIEDPLEKTEVMKTTENYLRTTDVTKTIAESLGNTEDIKKTEGPIGRTEVIKSTEDSQRLTDVKLNTKEDPLGNADLIEITDNLGNIGVLETREDSLRSVDLNEITDTLGNTGVLETREYSLGSADLQDPLGMLEVIETRKIETINTKIVSQSDNVSESCHLDTDANVMLDKTHSIKTLFICDICNKRLQRKSSLIKHIKNHSLLYKCAYCPYKSRFRNSIKIHTNSNHTRLISYNCSHCSYVTYRKNYLFLHIKNKHNKTISYNCSQCSFVTYWKNNLNIHMKNKHSNRISYDCSYCSYKTYKMLSLICHINNRHTNPNTLQFNCSLCSFSTCDGSHLHEHMSLKHAKKTYNCPLCSYESDSETCLSVHINIKHTKKKSYNSSFLSFLESESEKISTDTKDTDRPFFCSAEGNASMHTP